MKCIPVIRCVGILLKEIILDDPGDLQCDLVSVRQGGFTDQLHDLSEIVFFLQDLTNLGPVKLLIR